MSYTCAECGEMFNTFEDAMKHSKKNLHPTIISETYKNKAHYHYPENKKRRNTDGNKK